MADSPNKIDQYLLLSLIATGKSSQVWEVLAEGTSDRFAMKLLSPEAMKDSQELQALKFEAKVGRSLDHPNLIRIYNVVVGREHAYLLMELFKSPNLKSFIANDLTAVHVHFKRIFECTCLALEQMHEKGWVHKDVKPDNILINKEGDVRVIDFSLSAKAAGGISKILGGKAKVIQGTRTYIAPEIIRKKAATPQSDIYSLGITMFEALTGKPPFAGISPNDLLQRHLSEKPPAPSFFNSNVTPEMDRLVLRMMAKEPGDRPATMQEIYGEVRNAVPFKVEITDEGHADRQADADELLKGLNSRLDSRTDAQRQELLKNNPELAQQFAARKPPAATRPPQNLARPPVASQPQALPRRPPAPAQPPTPALQAPAVQESAATQPMPVPSASPPTTGQGTSSEPSPAPAAPPHSSPSPRKPSSQPQSPVQPAERTSAAPQPSRQADPVMRPDAAAARKPASTSVFRFAVEPEQQPAQQAASKGRETSPGKGTGAAAPKRQPDADDDEIPFMEQLPPVH